MTRPRCLPTAVARAAPPVAAHGVPRRRDRRRPRWAMAEVCRLGRRSMGPAAAGVRCPRRRQVCRAGARASGVPRPARGGHRPGAGSRLRARETLLDAGTSAPAPRATSGASAGRSSWTPGSTGGWAPCSNRPSIAGRPRPAGHLTARRPAPRRGIAWLCPGWLQVCRALGPELAEDVRASSSMSFPTRRTPRRPTCSRTSLTTRVGAALEALCRATPLPFTVRCSPLTGMYRRWWHGDGAGPVALEAAWWRAGLPAGRPRAPAGRRGDPSGECA